MLAGLSGHAINYSEVARTLGVSQPTIQDFVKEYEVPYGIVIDNGESVRWITEGIVAIPFSFCI